MSAISSLDLALTALLLPLAAALCIAVVGAIRNEGKPAAMIAVGAALTALAASLMLLARQVSHPEAVALHVVRWLPSAGASMAEVGIRLDGVSVSMLLIVTSVAACVQIFSLGYMAHEPPPAFGRYYGFHSLFIFSMNLLVLAPNMLQLFAGWELVGLTSYLLIGFYYKKPSAARAAVKAFWITKFADMGLLIGLIILFALTGGFSWEATMTVAGATTVTLLLFVAVMGKSAQFPLHIWLPDAMEGPTPVSALLHAATMVAAGVYLIVRSQPLFLQAPTTLMVMAYIGGFTALFAAIIATVQTDIKRVLAYSTCSQLGYMICALGAGSLMAGFFHLTTHAFFKALLFLAAGSVIHAVHSNEMKDMGGLFGKMRTTAMVFIVGALALAGVPGLSGFFSKDLILESVHAAGLTVPWVFLLAAAFLTAFYMGRVIFLTFFGARSAAAEKAHEGGTSMTLPLLALSLATVGTGYLAGTFATLYGQEYHFHMGLSGALATGLGLGGLGLAWLIYGKKTISASSLAVFTPIGNLARSGLVDRAFQGVFRLVMLRFADLIGWIDRYVIDGLMNLIGYVAIQGGQKLRGSQTGNARDYVYAVIAGVIVLAVWGLST